MYDSVYKLAANISLSVGYEYKDDDFPILYFFLLIWWINHKRDLLYSSKLSDCIPRYFVVSAEKICCNIDRVENIII
jgi:hypothetical protein